MQDIVPRKSIREITKPYPPSSISRANTYAKNDSRQKPVEDLRIQKEEYPHKKIFNTPGTPRKHIGSSFVFVLLFLFIGGGFGFLHFQRSATVYITTEKQILTLTNEEIIIPEKETVLLTASTSTIISITTSTGTPISTKAKGTVTIYNTNSTEQPLVAGTRLETPKGLIYKIDAKVTVPKATIAAGKTIPGSIEAIVTADKAGESFNITQSDFTFPGLIGSPRFKNVYARTKSVISGGSQTGPRVVNEKDKDQKIEAFKHQVTPLLTDELNAKKNPSSLEIEELSIKTTFEKITDIEGKVTLTASARYVDQKVLATTITKNQKQGSTTQMEFSGDTTKLTVDFIALEKEQVRVKVNGTVSVQNDIDTEKVRTILTGKLFNQFRELVKQIEGIKETRFTSKPFWTTAFPEKNRIFIEEK